MPDRQTIAVACALNPDPNGGYIKAHLDPAREAIAASDAKYIPMLVDVLRECLHHAMGGGANWELTHQYPEMASDMDWIGRKARDAIASIPEEYRK